MTAEEFISTDEEVSATEELGDNWEKELVDDFINRQNPDLDVEPQEQPKDNEVEEGKNISVVLKMLHTNFNEERTNGQLLISCNSGER